MQDEINLDRPVRVLCCNIPTTACNLNCHFCYVARDRHPKAPPEKLYDPELVAKALTIERLGGKAYVHMCAWGETFLDPQIVKTARLLLENGHYVGISHNGTIRRVIDEFNAFPPELKERLHYFVSLQWDELKKKNMLEQYADNVRSIKMANISFSVSVTLEDILISEIPEIKAFCIKEFGVLCHILECRDEKKRQIPRMTKLPLEEHQRLWGSFDSLTFATQQTYWGEYRNEFCYMGEAAAYVDFGSGNMWQACHGKKLCNIFDDLDEPIRFCALGHNCQVAHCYLGNILIGFGGCIPEIPYPSFAVQRDRVCADGTTWLTPKVRSFLQQRAINNLPPYSRNKKIWVDAVMGVVYGRKKQRTSNEELTAILQKALKGRGIHTVNVQGQAKPLGEFVYDLLKQTDLDISPLRSRMETVDMTIVTDYDDFPNVRRSLQNKGIKNLVSVLELVD